MAVFPPNRTETDPSFVFSHPDRNSSEEAKEKMIKITMAYEILSDPEKRAEYEQLLKHGTKWI